jgi:3-oxoacyl-[acyl-carrier-protein] synthase-3
MTATPSGPATGPAARAAWKATEKDAVGVLGAGKHLPDRIVDNAELAALLGVEPSWIADTTGGARRRLAGPGVSAADLVTGAVRDALRTTGVRPDEVSVLVVAAETEPGARPAASVRRRLEMGGAALDVAGDFVAALAVAERIVLAAGGYGVVAGVQVQPISPLDRSASARLGDGAGALVLGRTWHGRGLDAIELAGDGGADAPAFLDGAQVPAGAVVHVVGDDSGLREARVHSVEHDMGDTGPAAIPLTLALAPPIAPGERVLLAGPPDHPSLALLTW